MVFVNSLLVLFLDYTLQKCFLCYMRITYILCCLILFSSCGSKPKWTNLIGTYTIAEAMRVYGPPDRKENLGNGNYLYSWRLSEALNHQTKLLLEFDQNNILRSGRKVIFYTAGEPNIIEN